ncbi:MAG: transglutaminase-like domain-containing protein [Acidobacteriota bacterium]
MSRRQLLGLGLVVLWLVPTAVLVHREWGAPVVRTTGDVDAGPSERWLGIYLAERRVGHAHVVDLPESRDGQDGRSTRITSRLALELMGKPTDLELEGSMWRTRTPRPTARLEARLASADTELAIDATIDEGTLRGTVLSAGERLPIELPLGADAWLDGGMGTALRFPTLEPGDTVRLESFDLLSMRRSWARVRCLAIEPLALESADGQRVVEARKLEIDQSGLRTLAWVDGDGEVLRASTPLGLEIRRLDGPPRDALDAARPDDLVELSAIRPRGPTPFRGARRLVLKLSGDRLPAVPEDTHQQRDADRVVLVGAADAAFDDRRPGAEDQQADPFVQSDHPEIRSTAQRIVGAAATAEERAERIHRWVADELAKEPVVSVPSALEVLASRRGDCNEHTVLFTALARAVDLPTRIAIGLVWSDALGGFYYHAWPEVWLDDDGWRRFDPTLDQEVADATHLKLLEGGIERWPRLLPYLGSLEIEVVEVE